MKTYREELWFNTKTRQAFINDDEDGLHQDFSEFLEKLAPYDVKKYRHNLTGENNGDAHIKRQIFGREVVVAVTHGKLDFGPWEQIFYGDKPAPFDGGGGARLKNIEARFRNRNSIPRLKLFRILAWVN